MARARSICNTPGCPNTATQRGKCTTHARQQDRHYKRTVATKQDEPRSRKRRAEAVRQWVEKHGWVCPGYKRGPHPSHDLTAQHSHALTLGGDTRQPITVLCRSCNSRHGIDTRHQNEQRYQ